jgi:hypothetical protein
MSAILCTPASPVILNRGEATVRDLMMRVQWQCGGEGLPKRLRGN